ncbi:MAG: rhomboid family intramembrane serine protease, partial [Actinomycetota bacterium]|nr:rhomboid family intramembrane serine protease [Actinomycetota bacterium]
MSDRLGPDRTNGLLLVAAMVALMWATEVVDQIGFGELDAYGIQPRDVDALPEILAAPFLHVGFGHLISNTVPFLVMGAAIALGGLLRVALVTLVVALVSGFGTWLIADSDSVHLGASGVVFGYAAYLVARGLFSRRLVELGVGALVVVI